MPESPADEDPTLQAAAAPALAAVPAQRELPSAAGLTYYIIDDEDMVINVFDANLQYKWKVPPTAQLGQASSADEAIGGLGKFVKAPDFIVLDWSVGAESFVRKFAQMLDDSEPLAAVFKDTKIVVHSAEATDSDVEKLRAISPKVSIIGRLQKPDPHGMSHERLLLMLADQRVVKKDDVVEAARIALIPGEFSEDLTNRLKRTLRLEEVSAKDFIAVAVILGLVNGARRSAKIDELTQFDFEFDAVLAAVVEQFPKLEPYQILSIGADLLFAKKAEAAS